MDKITITKETIKQLCEDKMSTHTDWTGTYVESKNKCESVSKFIDSLWEYLENHNT